jgi:hypothetical protein
LKALPPWADYNTKAATHPDKTTDPTILTQLRMTAMDEHELQIIFATIDVHAAAPAWSLQQGVILYNGCYYILPPSISLHRISLRRNDQGAANNADLYLRQGAVNEQPRSNKYRQGAANEHQMRSTYKKPNPWS